MRIINTQIDAVDNRDITFDIMKGVGILLVMIGHFNITRWLGQFINSFHMPMFVLLSGYFCKPICGDFGRRVSKNAKRLVLPFLITQSLLILWGLGLAYAKHDISFVMRPILSLLWGNVQDVDTQYGSVFIGPMWFLLALFFGKSLFEWILSKMQDWKLIAVCIAVSVLAVFIKNKGVLLPWSMLQGLSFLVFLCIGWMAKKYKVSRWVAALAVLCWPFSVLFSSFDMAGCIYHCYPLNVIGSCGGTVCLWWLALQIKKVGIVARPLTWCGMYTLVILCFHNFEMFSSISYSLVIHSHFELEGLPMFMFRMIVTVFMAAAVIRIPYLRKLYGVNH